MVSCLEYVKKLRQRHSHIRERLIFQILESSINTLKLELSIFALRFAHVRQCLHQPMDAVELELIGRIILFESMILWIINKYINFETADICRLNRFVNNRVNSAVPLHGFLSSRVLFLLLHYFFIYLIIIQFVFLR